MNTKDALLQNIKLIVMNYDWNRDFLKGVPHVRFLDLAFACISYDSSTQEEHIVMQKQADELGITLSELFSAASNNSSDYVVKTMFETMRELQSENETEDEELEELLSVEEREQESHQMYVVTNQKKLFGAAVLLEKQPFIDISRQTESDLYVLPSSRHEVLVVPADPDRLEEYKCVVENINANPFVVQPWNVLSNSVYKWDRKLEKLLIA